MSPAQIPLYGKHGALGVVPYSRIMVLGFIVFADDHTIGIQNSRVVTLILSPDNAHDPVRY